MIYLVPDLHCRSFYKPILNIKDTPIVFMGDYMDPYYWEGFTDEEGIEKLKEVIEFARNNKNVVLLIGNHDEESVWSRMGFSRTDARFYKELHKIYRDNIDLFRPIYKTENTIFTHAGINNGWVDAINCILQKDGSTFQITEDNIIDYINNEFQLELKSDIAPNQSFWGSSLNSRIFDIGRSRGGDAPFGGPFWSDFYDDFSQPKNWKCYQIVSHQQQERTGSISKSYDGFAACIDSRAIFEYYPETGLIKPSEINDDYTKEQISEKDWKGIYLGHTESIEESI